MHIESWVFELLSIPVFLLVLREARIIYGREKASIFLWGSILWTATIENMNVIVGGYDYFAYANYYSFGSKLIEGYGGYTAWILFVPLVVCVGWFILSFPAFLISIRFFGEKSSIWLKAAFGGIILVSYDVLFDPIAVVNEWWRWTMPALHWHGVPIGNWMGWFFLLFFFAAVYERTVIQQKGFRWLSWIERLIFRTDTSNLSKMETRRVGKVFYFRLIAFLPLFIMANTILAGLTTEYWNNRYAPFNNVFPHPPEFKKFYTPPEGVTPLNHISPYLHMNKEDKGDTE